MKLCISRKAKTHNMSGYTEPIYQNEHTTFISSTMLWSHIQLILQMYLDMKRFKNQERSAVLLLLPIQHIDGNTIFSSFLPQARPRQLNCPLKKKRAAYFQATTLPILPNISYNPTKLLEHAHTPVTWLNILLTKVYTCKWEFCILL